MAARSRQRRAVVLGGDAAGVKQRAAVAVVEMVEAMHAQQRRPLRVVAPAFIRRLPSGADDEPARRQLRQEFVAQPRMQRRELLAGVDEQHSGIVVRLRQIQPDRVDERMRLRRHESRVDAHDAPRRGGGPITQLREQRALADAARSVEPEQGERRQRRCERIVE